MNNEQAMSILIQYKRQCRQRNVFEAINLAIESLVISCLNDKESVKINGAEGYSTEK